VKLVWWFMQHRPDEKISRLVQKKSLRIKSAFP